MCEAHIKFDYNLIISNRQSMNQLINPPITIMFIYKKMNDFYAGNAKNLAESLCADRINI